VNSSKARLYYGHGAQLADRMCWEQLSQFEHEGRGGPRDNAEAYYWIALETRCVDPRSIGGKQSWAQRNEIAKSLPLRELRQQWLRIDDYISRVRSEKIQVHSVPFGKGEYNPDNWQESMRLSDEAEAEHRRQMEERG
jgi:hypothetical protein